MNQLFVIVLTHGLPFLFLNVLLEQIGLPIPAMPVLVVAGALAVDRGFSAPLALLAAVVASVIADALWYWLGRRQGTHVLKTLCRISLSPDSCVRQTENVFERWGLPSLLFAKFVPGFSTVAPPMAGAIGASFWSFLLYDAGGAAIWAGSGIALGMIFHSAVDRVLTFLASIGSRALLVLGAALLLFVALKWWQRQRFYKTLRMARISAEELRRLMDAGSGPAVVDVRSDVARAADPRRVPGALLIEASELDKTLSALPKNREIVLYCT